MIRGCISSLTPSHDQLKQLIHDYNDEFDGLIVNDWVDLLDIYTSSKLTYDLFLQRSQFLLEYTWEKLHTGHWRNVSQCWRSLYAAVRLIRALYMLRDPSDADPPASKFQLILKELDFSLLMGYPIFDAVATNLASLVHEHLMENIEPARTVMNSMDNLEDFCPSSIPQLRSLQRISRPSLERFQELIQIGHPFIISDAMNHWPACKPSGDHHWTINYWLKRAAFRIVPIEIGSRYTDESWGQELITVEQFVNRFMSSTQPSPRLGYLAQHQLFLQIPELGDDVFTPDYCLINGKDLCVESTVDSNVWFGPPNTVSPLHHDSDRANLLCQVNGRKYIILYTAAETPYLYPFGETMLSNTSQLDAEHPDFDTYPQHHKARGFHGVINPGDMVYIPPRCWHYIRALSVSFSVNFWWDVTDSLIPPWPAK